MKHVLIMYLYTILVVVRQRTISYLEDFEPSNIEHADEVLPLVLRLQGLVAATD